MEPIGNNLLGGYGSSPFMGEQSMNFLGGSGPGGMPFGGGDAFGSMQPPNYGYGYGSAGGSASVAGFFGGFMSMMQGFMNQVARMMQGAPEQQPCSGSGQSQTQGTQPRQYFSNASLSSTGDPHDAFNGTTGAGQQVNGKWDNMRGHNHLISSDSIPGGFNVATQASAPQANGVAYNQSATITANHGDTSVTMGQNGAYSVVDRGQAVALTPGQTTSLGRGETVTLNNNGSLCVGVSNGQGGSINTTLSYNGNGVDVNATANNVNLGGYLVGREDA